MYFYRNNMNDLANSDLKSINNLTRLYSSSGKDKKAWSDLIVSLNESQSQSNINITSFFIKKMIDEPRNWIFYLIMVQYLLYINFLPLVLCQTF